MARENYLSLSVTPSEMMVFDAFVKEKGITKTAALQDMLEMYMVATDEETYVRLKKEILHIDVVKKLMEQRAQRQSHLAAPFVFDSFWLRATEAEAEIDGEIRTISAETMIEIYNRLSTTHGSVLFSCNGPARNTGISENRQKYVRSRLESGLPIKIYVSVGNAQMYSAEVLDVISGSDAIRPNDIASIPEEFLFEKNRTWFRITAFRLENTDSIDKLKFENGGAVSDTMKKSQLSFGYVVSE